MKTCKRCGQSKPLDDFHKSKMTLATGEVRYYPKPFCKPCGVEVRKGYTAGKGKKAEQEYRNNRDKFIVGNFICY